MAEVRPLAAEADVARLTAQVATLEQLLETIEETVSNQAAQLEQALETLEHRNAELRHTNDELQHFAYIASHDLQEPLRMISSYTQLLQRRYGEKLDDEAREFIQYAVDGANRMQALIEGLLEYSRIGTHGREFQAVDLNEIMRAVRDDLHIRIEETGGTLEIDDLPTVRADRLQMRQLLQNLVGNALKFRRRDVAPEVRVTAQRTHNGWRFAVSDNGIGIDARYVDRIFHVFQRLHTRSEYPGTGIGLAICRRIVERHGGELTVESEPGAGSTFHFTLPHSEATS